MRSLHHLSINAKLILLAVAAASTALVLSSTAFVVNDVQRIRLSTVEQLAAMASVVGANSTAALQFDDPISAAEMLESLRQQPSVAVAAIYNDEGQLFATYARPGAGQALPSAVPAEGMRFTEDGHLDLAQPIMHDGQAVGAIYIHSSLEELHGQFSRYVAIVAVIFVVALTAAAMLSTWLQRKISRPILELADTARLISASRDFSIRVHRRSEDELGVLFDQFNTMLDEIQRGEAELQNAHNELEHRVAERTAQLTHSNEELSREVAERIRAEEELEAAHHRLMDTARRAGMAEIATGVLHNVGNVLNSINISATLVADSLRQSKLSQLARAVALLDEHEDDLASYVATDTQGKQIPRFLRIVTDHLLAEHREMIGESETLTTKVDHVKAIIATQQSYAGATGVIESFDLSETLEDSIKLQSAAFERHGIRISREFAELPPVVADKQKLLQILINLVKNAKDAMLQGGKQNTLTIRTLLLDDAVRVEVCDTGVGIHQENLTRIFSHGFTTKADGHGFGLHSCANAAREMGGSLSARSDGLGKGASFILELPLRCSAKVLTA